MRFDNEFEVSGRPSDVIEKFADVPVMATLLPGASVEPQNSDGSYSGTLVVSFGPKRLAFKGKIKNQVDRASCSGVLTGQGSADVRGAKMAATMNYSLVAVPERDATQVRLVSEVQLAGILAEFAKTGGVVLANVILKEFARRFSRPRPQGNCALLMRIRRICANSSVAILEAMAPHISTRNDNPVGAHLDEVSHQDTA